MGRRRTSDLAFVAATAFLSPALLAQALHVRRVTVRLPEADGAREGQCGAGPPLRLLILGDSAAAGVGANTQDEALAGQLARHLAPHVSLHWRLLANTGDTTLGALRRLEAAPELRCDVALTSLGVNDVTTLRSTRAFLDAQRRLIDHLRARCGARRLLISGLPPMRHFPALPQPLRWALGRHASSLDNALAEWIATQPDCEHLPFGSLLDATMMATDGFHPGPRIYSAWAEAAAERITKRFAPATTTRVTPISLC